MEIFVLIATVGALMLIVLGLVMVGVVCPIKFKPLTPKSLSAIGFLVIYELKINHTEEHNINSVLE